MRRDEAAPILCGAGSAGMDGCCCREVTMDGDEADVLTCRAEAAFSLEDLTGLVSRTTQSSSESSITTGC